MTLTKPERLRNYRKTYFEQLGRLSTWAVTFDSTSTTIHMVEAKLILLDKVMNNFEQNQSEIEEIDLKDDDQEQRIKFEDEAATVMSTLLGLKQKVGQNTSFTTHHENTQSFPVESYDVPDLPPISLPTFAGDYDEYIPFKATFDSLVHENQSRGMNDLRRFALLRDACRGRAFDAIKHLILTPENYEVARTILENRFHKVRLIFDAHINKLFNVTPVKNATDLRALSDLFDAEWKALGILTASEYHIGEGVLIHLALKKCDTETVRRWEEKLAQNDAKNIPTWTEFSNFLQQRCSMLENYRFTKSYYEKSNENKNATRPFRQSINRNTNITVNSTTCPCCKGDCKTVNSCKKFKEMNVEERFLLARAEKLCVRCLVRKPHSPCTEDICTKCERTHNTLLHFEDAVMLKNAWKKASEAAANQKLANAIAVEDLDEKEYDETLFSDDDIEQHYASNAAMVYDFSTTYTWLATAIVKVKDASGKLTPVRALLDAGSQISVISAKAFKRLDLPFQATNLRILGVNGDAHMINKAATIHIESNQGSAKFAIVAAVHQKLQQRHPFMSTSVDEWKIPGNCTLADPEFNKTRSIELILGADVFYKLLEGDRVSLGTNRPDLIKTTLGWVVAGPMDAPLINKACTLNFFTASADSTDYPVELEWMKRCWELEKQPEVKLWGPEELDCERHFQSTVTFNEGRYTVRLPFKQPTNLLGNSRQSAMSRLLGTERKMAHDDNYRTMYTAFMEEYERLGHMTEVKPPRADEPHNYLSHFGVWKLDSTTTQLRVVFDASCATSSGHSLNDLLMVGPTVQPDLFTHLLRLRTKRYILCGDISKMYRQVLVHDDDKKFLLILWRKPGEPIKTFQLNTVTYGTACAPYQATACLNDLANRFTDLPVGSMIVKECMYVDDMMAGDETVDGALTIYQETKELLARGGFTLRKFQSNSHEVMQQIPEVEHGSSVCIGDTEVIKTLGLNWNPDPDAFSFFYDTTQKGNKLSKRTVLSMASRLFDPLGLVQPLTVRAKMFIQQLWSIKADWDEQLPTTNEKTWREIQDELSQVGQIKVPRYIFAATKVVKVDIHGFSDASERAYAAAVYVRSVTYDHNVQVRLWCAKTKLSPLKTISISRLELCGALLLAELYAGTVKRCQIHPDEVHLWTDSTITLGWITTSPHLRTTFVANRVTKIQDLTSDCIWHHVPGEHNPADIASRGAKLAQLQTDSVWFNGPNFLYQGIENWPQAPPVPDELPDTKLQQTTLTVQSEPDPVMMIKFEKYPRVRRTMAFVGRFLAAIAKKVRKSHPVAILFDKLPKTERHESPHREVLVSKNIGCQKVECLSSAELQTGEILAVKIIQQTYFNQEINQLNKKKALTPQHPLASLTPFLDGSNIIRVGGRLNNCEHLSYDERHQYLLPANHSFTTKLFIWTHEKILHGGPNVILSTIRRKFWVPRGKYMANRAFKKCITCFRAKPITYKQVMGQLPKERTRLVSRPFITCGIDYCGPFTIHYKGRGSRTSTMYLAVFVCFSTKAVHLELVEDLTTAAFINTLRRFMNRRGVPKRIWSDNATNFRGSSRILEDLIKLLERPQHWTAVYDWCANTGTEWAFIPPRSPHFGGLWEAAVKSAKHHLIRVAGSAPLYRDETDTLITEVEKCLNNRPSIPLSVNPRDGLPITPSHFLIGEPINELSEPVLVDDDPSTLRRYERVLAMKQNFWRQWSREYFHTLQNMYKWSKQAGKEPKLDEVVLLVDMNVPSQRWQLGRIIRLFPGKDTKVRVVEVKTSTGIYKRAITELCPLPMEEAALSMGLNGGGNV